MIELNILNGVLNDYLKGYIVNNPDVLNFLSYVIMYACHIFYKCLQHGQGENTHK